MIAILIRIYEYNRRPVPSSLYSLLAVRSDTDSNRVLHELSHGWVALPIEIVEYSDEEVLQVVVYLLS